MNTLREAIDDYLTMRRALGFKLTRVGWKLKHFADFLESHGADTITTLLARQWAMQPLDAKPATWAERLMHVRVFARYRQAADPRTEIPPDGLFPFRAERAKPYFYSEAEIHQLLAAAEALPPKDGLRAATYHCLFGLLVVTGMRISEVLILKRDDVDLTEGTLIVRGAKFDKSRLLPLHRSTQQVLAEYAHKRDARFPHPATSHFLVSDRGKPLEGSTVRRTFYALSRAIGLRGARDSRGPRLHDFRHRFARETLVRWYREGEDVACRLPVLSTYLGHAHVSDTYWYLAACPELMGEAKRRLEKRWEGRP